mmetsp:Transcript_17854/g.42228  ORF Transcript_17854/g.42228 Transcript_17854/m.42228 type:complete len:204 (+) Transcript_17854:3-614(+)
MARNTPEWESFHDRSESVPVAFPHGHSPLSPNSCTRVSLVGGGHAGSLEHWNACFSHDPAEVVAARKEKKIVVRWLAGAWTRRRIGSASKVARGLSFVMDSSLQQLIFDRKMSSITWGVRTMATEALTCATGTTAVTATGTNISCISSAMAFCAGSLRISSYAEPPVSAYCTSPERSLSRTCAALSFPVPMLSIARLLASFRT